MNEQQPNQQTQALYSYCKVMRVPKLGPIPAVITILEGFFLTLVIAALGESFSTALAIGAIVSAVFAFLCWLAYRYRVGASKRLNSYLVADGGRSMYSDFATAQPFAHDQFRVGKYFLFIKNGAVLRLDDIVDIVRINSHYRMMPTGVGLSVIVRDESGRMSAPLCILNVINAEAKVDEIRKAVLKLKKKEC